MKASHKSARRFFPEPGIDDLSDPAHRQLIGGVGMLLPILLWFIAGSRNAGDHPWNTLSSISAYYYTGAVSAFAGVLVAIGLFLFAYRGYRNRYYLRDRVAAILAGSAAILIALFPTDAPDDSLIPIWWTPQTGRIHLFAGAVLLGCFTFFSLYQFPKSSVDNEKALPSEKERRNRVYRLCGVTMLVCILWIIYALYRRTPIYVPEVIAFEAFAVSWLVKGRFPETAAAVGGQCAYYGKRPVQLAKDIWSAVRGGVDSTYQSAITRGRTYRRLIEAADSLLAGKNELDDTTALIDVRRIGAEKLRALMATLPPEVRAQIRAANDK